MNRDFITNISDGNIHDFIKHLCKNKIQLILPEVQRPLAWDANKVNGIFKNKNKEYFGHITLKKNGNSNTFSLIDGQQRLSTFVMAYNIAVGISGEQCVLDSLYLNNDERTSFRKIYGPVGAKGSFSEEEIKKIRADIGIYGYIDNYESIKALNVENIIKKLKEIYLSFSVIPEEISEYDVFISMNYSGVPLAQSDILKALFIKKLVDQTKPTDVKEPWQRMLRQAAESNANLDKLIVRFLSARTRGITKGKFVYFYKNAIDKEILKIEESKESKVKLDGFIAKEVEDMATFVSGYARAMTFKEGILKVANSVEKFYDALVKFALNSGMIYKPYITFILEYRKSLYNKPDKLKDFISFILISFYMHQLNKFSKKNARENYTFLMGNKFRTNIESMFQEYDLTNFNWKMFSIAFNSGDSLKIYKDRNIWELVFENIIKRTMDKTYGKSIRILLEWYFDDSTKEFFDYKNSLTIEHIEETINIKRGGKCVNISEKNTNYNKVIFINKETHYNINNEIKIIKEKHKSSKTSKKNIAFEILTMKYKNYKLSKNSFAKTWEIKKDYKTHFKDFLISNLNSTPLFQQMEKCTLSNYKKQKLKKEV